MTQTRKWALRCPRTEARNKWLKVADIKFIPRNFLSCLYWCFTWKNIIVHAILPSSSFLFIVDLGEHPTSNQSLLGSVKVRLGWPRDYLMFTDSRSGVQVSDAVNRCQTQLPLGLLFENFPGLAAWRWEPRVPWKLVRGSQEEAVHALLPARAPREWAFLASLSCNHALGAIAGPVAFCLGPVA